MMRNLKMLFIPLLVFLGLSCSNPKAEITVQQLGGTLSENGADRLFYVIIDKLSGDLGMGDFDVYVRMPDGKEERLNAMPMKTASDDKLTTGDSLQVFETATNLFDESAYLKSFKILFVQRLKDGKTRTMAEGLWEPAV